MISLLLSLILLSDSMIVSSEKIDSIRTDTLQEVTVLPLRRLPIEDVLRESLDCQENLHVPTLSEILEKNRPGLLDVIMHPFAFKQRKREKMHRQSMKVLEEYGRVRSFDELIREAYEKQMLEDSLMNSNKAAE
ncbi:MAG: hypothetical protein K6G70_07975 [Bacteroidaceae bacterium]|nr:hypothetical protein [Bacteroidaceae bacterium]